MRERDVVLECGCVTSPHGALRVLGERHEYQTCKTHPVDNGRGQKIIREATIGERISFLYAGKPAPKRRAKRTHNFVFDLPGVIPGETERTREQERTLF